MTLVANSSIQNLAAQKGHTSAVKKASTLALEDSESVAPTDFLSLLDQIQSAKNEQVEQGPVETFTTNEGEVIPLKIESEQTILPEKQNKIVSFKSQFNEIKQGDENPFHELKKAASELQKSLDQKQVKSPIRSYDIFPKNAQTENSSQNNVKLGFINGDQSKIQTEFNISKNIGSLSKEIENYQPNDTASVENQSSDPSLEFINNRSIFSNKQTVNSKNVLDSKNLLNRNKSNIESLDPSILKNKPNDNELENATIKMVKEEDGNVLNFPRKTISNKEKQNIVNKFDSETSSGPYSKNQIDFFKQDMSTQNRPLTVGLVASSLTPVLSSVKSKVLDLRGIESNDVNKMINQIAQYVDTNRLQAKQGFDLTVKHETLGEFTIHVHRNDKLKATTGSDPIDMLISSKNVEAHNFFTQNENKLSQALNQSGIHLAELKLSGPSERGQSFDSQPQNFQSGQNDSSHREQSGQLSQRQQDTRDSERRRDLWKMYQERMGA